MRYTSRIILDNKLSLLSREIYRDVTPINGWQAKEVSYPEALRFSEIGDDWHPIARGDHWKAYYNRTHFFRVDARIPLSFTGHQPLLLLNLGGEGQVRINGEIVSGVVSYKGSFLAERLRTRVLVPGKYRPGDTIHIEVEACLNFLESSYTISPDAPEPFAEYTFTQAEFAWADEAIEAYYFDLKNAVEAMDTFENPVATLQQSNARVLNGTVRRIMQRLNDQSGLHERLFKACMQSTDLLELEFGYERLKASVPAASEALKAALRAMPDQAVGMVKFVGQSHIDTAWLWPLKESVRKCGKTFSNVLDLMNRYPEFIFAFSQPQLFAYTEEFYPDLFEQVKRRVAEGRIELVGNAWVEMDTNVPSGESLIRQLLYGRAYYLDKFGKSSRVFWMPDVFGYSWSLPQIMKRSGVDYFFTSKLVNNDTNNFPHSLFMWQGVDGTRILSYLQRLGYNGEYDAATLSDIWSMFNQKDVCDTALMTIGYGDGGGGPSYQMLENAQRLKDFPGLPQSEFATSVSFFEQAEQAQSDLPVWNDEMYYEFHRGTYTSQANTKKHNRKGEYLLRRAEIACAMTSVRLGEKYPAKELADLWKPLLTNQFHDILPGSSIHQVYEDCEEIYAHVFTGAQAILDGAMARLNAALGLRDGQIAVWNYTSWPVTQAVTVNAAEGLTLLDDASHPVPCQRNQDGALCFIATDVPPMGARVYTLAQAAPATSAVTATVHKLENEHLAVTLDDNGNITSLYDKDNSRECFQQGSINNLLTIFEDIPHRESAWNIDMEYDNHFWPLTQAESVTLISAGPARAVVRTVRVFNESTITQDITLAAGARQVDFVTHVDWHETQRMLKAAFTPDVLASKATYEIQFGAIERPTHRNTSYDAARFEVCAHKWADLSEGRYGVSLLNDCKYGYDILGSRMRITLLRAPNYPDPVGDKGEHDFTYAICPHAGDWRQGDVVRQAYALNVPLEAYAGSGQGTGADLPSFAWVDEPNVIIDTIKGAEDGRGLILRLYESQGARCTAHVHLGFDAAQVISCNLMEDDEETLAFNGNDVDVYIKPYQIITLRIQVS